MSIQGRFIAIEGIDGSGKETQSRLLLDYLNTQGVCTELFSFPDYTHPIGKLISGHLERKHEMDVKVLFLLHTADKVNRCSDIRQYIRQGKIVIADRWFNSTIAYQCASGFSLEDALEIANTMDILKPDCVIYLKISPETSIRRKQKQKKNLDRFEENLSLLEKVSDFYDKLARENIFGKWFVIDGEKSIEEVFEQVKKVLGV